ncbi:YbaK/EbsC family protein [Patescibacteria group bacterium]
MSISTKVLNYLKKNDIEVKVQGHKKVYTAYDLAKTMNEKLNKIGKTLLVKADGKPYLVLVPGHYYLDLKKIKKELKAKKVELANEKHIKKVLDMKPGALYPFAKLHKLELLLDRTLLKSKDAIVRAGSFTESLRMKVKDLHKMEDATVGDFGKLAVKAAKKAPKKVKKAAATAKKTARKVKKAVKKASKNKYVKKAMKKKSVKKAIKKVKKTVKKATRKSPIKVKAKKSKGKKSKKVTRVTISKMPAIKRKRKKR